MRWLEVLAVGVFTFESTGSALWVALMLFARTAPSAALGVVIGAIAGHIDRSRLMVAAMCLLAAVASLLAWLASNQMLALWHVALGASISGAVWTLEHPVRRTLVGDVAGRERLGTAMSLDQVTVNATRMSGPLFGGAIYASLGMVGVYAVGALAYAAAAAIACVVCFTSFGPTRAERAPLLSSVLAGFRYVRGNRLLSAVMVVTLAANFFGFSYASMIPVIGKTSLDLDALLIGLLQSMEGLGALIGAIVLAFRLQIPDPLRTFFVGSAAFLVMLLVFAQSTYVVVSMFALVVAGVGLAGFGAMQSTLVLSTSAPEQRTRVMGVLVMCIGAGPLGVITMGALAQLFGAAVALSAMSVAGIAVLFGAAVCWPELWRSRAETV